MSMNRKIEAFKRELGNYYFYVDDIKKTNGTIDEVFYRVGGARGIDPGKVHSSAPVSLAEKLDSVQPELTLLEARLKMEEASVKYVNLMLSMMPDDRIKEAMARVYMYGEHLEDICDDYGYSPQGLHHRINREIRKLLNMRRIYGLNVVN